MSKICGTSAARGGPNLLRITSPARLAFSSSSVIHRLLLAPCRCFLPPTPRPLPADIPSVARFPSPPPLLLFVLLSPSAVCLFAFQSCDVPRIFAVLLFVYFQSCIPFPSCSNVLLFSSVRHFFPFSSGKFLPLLALLSQLSILYLSVFDFRFVLV